MKADEAQKAFQALAPEGTKVKLSEVSGTAIFYAVDKDGKKSEECLFDPYELGAMTATSDAFLATGEKLFQPIQRLDAPVAPAIEVLSKEQAEDAGIVPKKAVKATAKPLATLDELGGKTDAKK